MNKIFTPIFCLFLWLSCLASIDVNAQTVNIGTIDPGPYGQGSTIAVPFAINTTTDCIGVNNVFNLYLSDASGSFAVPKLIGTFSGAYGTFVNGVIPDGTPAGSGYKLRITSNAPSSTSAVSAAFTISASPGVSAGAASQLLRPENTEVFGSCIGVENTSYPFVNSSTAGAVVKATFFNELTKANEGTFVINANFIAKAANYTVNVRAEKGGIVGTKAYMLINNVVNNGFAASGATTSCLTGGQVTRQYSLDITSPAGIQKNFPGLIYKVTWGDGGSDNYTICDIVKAGGMISHIYKKSSCGNVANGQVNVFQINFLPVSPYCDNLVSPFSNYVNISEQPVNKIDGPKAACTNGVTTFNNSSIPGQDPNSKSFDCTNKSALYTWLVDGEVIGVNYPIEKAFEYTFLKNGNHTVTLRFQNSALCDVADKDISVCVQDPPKPSFTLPVTEFCSAGSVTPINTSVIDNNCNPNNSYKWTVTGPAPVGYAGGTSATSENPQFKFSTAGVYTIQLGVVTASCGTIFSASQDVIVNQSPTADLSPNTLICGKNRILTFGPNAIETKTVINGTMQPLPTTYTWTVTGGSYKFENGTTANSQYPQISFNDYAVYTITVIHVNNCGSATDTQQLTFQESPIVIAGNDFTICEGNLAGLSGSVTGTYNSFKWVGGTGTFADPSKLNTTYTPSADEIKAGTVTLGLEVLTNLAAPCNKIISPITITITQKDNITSANTADACTGSNFTYNIRSSNPATTYAWTAAVTSGSASGFAASGSGNTINDVITDGGTTDAIVTYTITPTTNGCPGNPFTLDVRIRLTPVATAVAANASSCTGLPAAIVLTSNVPGTTFTWTSTATAGITGNSTQATPAALTNITDVLTNSNTVAGSVTYTITPFNGFCAGIPVTATVNVQPLPVPSIPGPDQEICAAASYKLNANDPSPGTGKWTVASGQTGITFSNDTDPSAVVSGLLPGNVYKFVWTITTAPTCPPTSNVVTITVDNSSFGGTVNGGTAVCAGTNHVELNLSGNVGNVLRWEYTTDGGVNWVAVSNATNVLMVDNITQTTQYRAIVQNGLCDPQASNLATITVNQPVFAANAGVDITLCNTTFATLGANDPAPYTGIWTQTAGPLVIIAEPANPHTQITGLTGNNIYKFVWTIQGVSPCGDSSDEVVVTDVPDIIASFTSNNTNSVCGPVTVQFSNTSSPSIATTSYLWDFGDGTGNSNNVSPQHTFQPRTDGKDTTYTVSLSIVNNCLARPAYTYNVTVRPATPVAAILPDRLTACGSLAIKVQNISPGGSGTYDYFIYDRDTQIAHLTKTDKSDVVFDPLGPSVHDKFYTLYMVVTDFCGNTAKSTPIPITISPATFVAQMHVKVGESTKGCGVLQTVFVNNSSGGDTFQYDVWNTTDNTHQIIQGAVLEQPYTFTKPGVYQVKIIAINDCATKVATDAVKFVVFDIPQPNLDADIRSGCKSLRVNFKNLTPDNGETPSNALTYDWDFGDGSHFAGFTPTPHTFTANNSPYTITLTVTNQATGCVNTIVKTAFINVTKAPGVMFSVKPDTVTTIPNYHFEFDDETSGNPVAWQWKFGDGGTSTNQNPGHTYADTGSYKVTLKVINREGCDSTITRTVRITGTPGQLYLPNAFMPSSGTEELRTFTGKGSGLASWRLQVFNNWGQLVWETTKLDDKGRPVDGWDGTFKGSPAPQGSYVWQATAKFINGTDWKGMSYNNSLPKRSGLVNLIR